MDDSSWWLLGSGASTAVLSERFAHDYGIDVSRTSSKDSPCRAASGIPVRMLRMLGKAEVGVRVVMADEWGESRVKRLARLKALVGNIQHIVTLSAQPHFSRLVGSSGREMTGVSL